MAGLKSSNMRPRSSGGESPRDIAATLNREGIPGPKSGLWNASTIAGSRKRANGILENSLYVGRIVWNRQSFIKDPETGRRVSRPNPKSEWMTAEAPELRIIDDDLFDRVRKRRTKRGGPERQHYQAAPARPPCAGELEVTSLNSRASAKRKCFMSHGLSTRLRIPLHLIVPRWLINRGSTGEARQPVSVSVGGLSGISRRMSKMNARSASRSGRGGRRFKSCHSDQKQT